MISIRPATPTDVPVLFDFLRQLAAFEGTPHAVVVTEAEFRDAAFGPAPKFEAIVAIEEAWRDGEPVGCALFHDRFSTWLGRPCLYAEDLFVVEHARGLGVGKRLMQRLAEIATERAWGRIDFQATPAAARFYDRLGFARSDRPSYGVDERALRELAANGSLAGGNWSG